MVWYVSGTRADYGLMRETLRAIDRHPALCLRILVTGMHLDPVYGETSREIAADGFTIAASVALGPSDTTGAGMARGIARMITGFTEALERERPDLVMLLGDRGEMLAGAIAAIHLNLPIAHIHGGERSGTVDEPIRHAISKLSHYHFAATEEASERLHRMGECRDHIFTVGAPGLVGLTTAATHDRTTLALEAGFDPARPLALFVYHPVLQEAESGGEIAETILTELARSGFQTVAIKPNSDSGSHHIRTVLDERADAPELMIATHLSRDIFISWMAAADVMIGNSSAGIIEAASFGTPVINVGRRQNLRQQSGNVIDTDSDAAAIAAALTTSQRIGRHTPHNVYGDGTADMRIAALLATLPLESVTWKSNGY